MNGELLNKALDFVGLKEIEGKGSNEIIEAMHESVIGVPLSDDVPWCSAFLNFICLQTGYERTRSLAARSWLEVGELINIPVRGCIAIFWRYSPRSWKGHAGIYIREDEENIWVLGGNQSNSVSIAPYKKSQLLGYVSLRKVAEFNEVFDPIS